MGLLYSTIDSVLYDMSVRVLSLFISRQRNGSLEYTFIQFSSHIFKVTYQSF